MFIEGKLRDHKKTAAIVVELIPVVSAILSFILIALAADSASIKRLIAVTTLLAFLGFVFFIIGRKLKKRDKTVWILGLLDWLATAYVIGLYVFAIFSFGL